MVNQTRKKLRSETFTLEIKYLKGYHIDSVHEINLER